MEQLTLTLQVQEAADGKKPESPAYNWNVITELHRLHTGPRTNEPIEEPYPDPPPAPVEDPVDPDEPGPAEDPEHQPVEG